MCTPVNLDDETIRIMRNAGCRKIGFGVESLSNDNLKILNKAQSSVQERTNNIMSLCDNHGLLTKAYLIIGYPWETFDSLTEFQNKITTLHADEIRISYFTPFPGSPAYEEYKDLLVTKDWSKFNAIRDIVIENKNGISADKLAEARIIAFKNFYGNKDRQKRISEKLNNFPEFKESFSEFAMFLKNAKVIE